MHTSKQCTSKLVKLCISACVLQNFTWLGGRPDFYVLHLESCIFPMRFHGGSNSKCATNFVQISEKERRRLRQ
jgi:hypothetical protein